MARNQEQSDRPLTDEEIEAFREAMDEQSDDLHEALADDLGGEPEDYQVDYPRADRLDE
jgi:hypothetical protein